MSFQDCQNIHRWLAAVVRSQPTRTDVEDCLDLLGKLDRAEKRDLWRWLAEYDPNLKQWLKLQGDRRGVA
ncbi:MAG: hypothetical protein AAFY20_10550 [Cyanobacteria bacterium J06639_14]